MPRDALLRDDLAGATRVGSWAAQTPAAPYDCSVDAASRTVGWARRFRRRSASRRDERRARRRPVSAAVTGIELDAWTEVVPNATGTGAVTANLAAPCARAPESDPARRAARRQSSPGPSDALLSVVDEALESGAMPPCRPRCHATGASTFAGHLPLPNSTTDDLDIRHLLNTAQQFPVRWVAKGTT